jgi:hypothetical protein
MPTYKCPTLGDCERANSGEMFTRSPGEDLHCPGCSTLLELQAVPQRGSGLDKRIIIAAVAVAVLAVAGGGGYYYKKSHANDGRGGADSHGGDGQHDIRSRRGGRGERG